MAPATVAHVPPYPKLELVVVRQEWVQAPLHESLRTAPDGTREIYFEKGRVHRGQGSFVWHGHPECIPKACDIVRDNRSDEQKASDRATWKSYKDAVAKYNAGMLIDKPSYPPAVVPVENPFKVHPSDAAREAEGAVTKADIDASMLRAENAELRDDVAKLTQLVQGLMDKAHDGSGGKKPPEEDGEEAPSKPASGKGGKGSGTKPAS